MWPNHLIFIATLAIKQDNITHEDLVPVKFNWLIVYLFLNNYISSSKLYHMHTRRYAAN